MDSKRVMSVFNRLSQAYGTQDWWPADSPFEVMVGAVLTQNTAWSNVERAISNLKQAEMLTPAVLASCSLAALAEQVRPAGYFNVKARRLRNFARFLLREGGEAGLSLLETGELRKRLLGVTGVGPETADDILLYAFHRPVFVVDAYTRRIGGRLGLCDPDAGYETLRHGFENSVGKDLAVMNEFHALLVRHAKEACRKKPGCESCCLADECASRESTKE